MEWTSFYRRGGFKKIRILDRLMDENSSNRVYHIRRWIIGSVSYSTENWRGSGWCLGYRVSIVVIIELHRECTVDPSQQIKRCWVMKGSKRLRSNIGTNHLDISYGLAQVSTHPRTVLWNTSWLEYFHPMENFRRSKRCVNIIVRFLG